MGRSIREWVTELNVQLRDTAGSQTIWSFDEKYRAIQEGLRQAHGFFRIPSVYTSLSVATGIREYGLPTFIRNVRAIDRAVTTVTRSAPTAWTPLRSWWVEPTAETVRLWIDVDYPASNLRIYYERDVDVVPVETTTTTAITATSPYIPVAATADFRVHQWPSPGFISLENEVIRYEAITATSFTGLFRGMFNTAPAAYTGNALTNSLPQGLGVFHSGGQALTPFIPDVPGALEEYVTAVARQQLFLTRLVDADVEASRQVASLAAQYGNDAERLRRQHRPFSWPRVAQQRFPRRL